jgi:hypothetical protein
MLAERSTRPPYSSTDETVVGIAERPGDAHSAGARLASRPPRLGRHRAGEVNSGPGGSCREEGPADRQPNRYHPSREKSRPVREGQGARAGGAWRGCVDCWQCRRDRRPAPAPRPRGASVAGAQHVATGEGQERQPLNLFGWPLGRPKSAGTSGPLLTVACDQHPVVAWLRV